MFRGLGASLGLVLMLTAMLYGQHDPHRNTTRLIASGDFGKVASSMKKAQQDDSETHFVFMMNALRQDKIDDALKHAKQAIDLGLPFGRFIAGPRDVLAPLYKTPAYKQWAAEHQNLRLIHGPMLGRLTDTSVAVWVRTANASVVQVNVFGKSSDKPTATGEGRTEEAADYTTVVKISGLRPNTAYRYEVKVDGHVQATENASFTTHGKQHEAGSFSVAFGGGAGFVPQWEYMWDTIIKQRPDAMLMLGDNVYIDDPTHMLTNRYCYYRRQSRPEWRRFVASTSMYAIYDDHDFGMNDCVPGPDIDKPSWKRSVWDYFRLNWVNPYYGGGVDQPGCWHDFYIADVHFILLDGRYYRDRGEQSRSMLGPVQKKWLKETIRNSKGTFKVIASPVPWTEGIKPGSKDPWDGFPQEREEIFSFIESNKIEGVFLVAADRHRSDLRVTKRENGYDLYEFESSRLTNRHTHGVIKTPGLIWGYKDTCSFGLMRFDTTGSDPSVKFEVYTIDGKRVHDYQLKLSVLKYAPGN